MKTFTQQEMDAIKIGLNQFTENRFAVKLEDMTQENLDALVELTNNLTKELDITEGREVRVIGPTKLSDMDDLLLQNLVIFLSSVADRLYKIALSKLVQ